MQYVDYAQSMEVIKDFNTLIGTYGIEPIFELVDEIQEKVMRRYGFDEIYKAFLKDVKEHPYDYLNLKEELSEAKKEDDMKVYVLSYSFKNAYRIENEAYQKFLQEYYQRLVTLSNAIQSIQDLINQQ